VGVQRNTHNKTACNDFILFTVGVGVAIDCANMAVGALAHLLPFCGMRNCLGPYARDTGPVRCEPSAGPAAARGSYWATTHRLKGQHVGLLYEKLLLKGPPLLKAYITMLIHPKEKRS
jgi:hypothetical protein